MESRIDLFTVVYNVGCLVVSWGQNTHVGFATTVAAGRIAGAAQVLGGLNRIHRIFFFRFGYGDFVDFAAFIFLAGLATFLAACFRSTGGGLIALLLAKEF